MCKGFVLTFVLLVCFSHLAFAMCEYTCEAFAENKDIESTWIDEAGKPGGFVDTTTYGCRISWAADCCTEEEKTKLCTRVLRIIPSDNEVEFTKDYEKEAGNDIWFLMKVGTYRTVWCDNPDDFQNPTAGFHITATFRFKDCDYWLKTAWEVAKRKLDACVAGGEEALGCEKERENKDNAKSALDKSETDKNTKKDTLAKDDVRLKTATTDRNTLEG